MGGHGHRFLAAGDDDPGIAESDLLHAKRYRAKTRTTKLVDAPGGRFLGNAGLDRGLTCRVLPFARRQDLPKDNFVHFRGLDPGATERAGDRRSAQFMRRHVGESAVEGSNGGSGGRRNYDGMAGHGRLLVVLFCRDSGKASL